MSELQGGSEDQNQYQKQQGDITALIEKYKDKRKNNVYKQLTNAFFNYEFLLESNYASPAKYTWLADQKKLVNNLKNEKAIENGQKNANKVTKQDIKNIGDDMNRGIVNINKDIQQAIKTSTYIRIQLDKQIESLDRIYDINKDTSTRIKRAMDGLRTMLRRIMLSKMTRFLSILTVIAIIGLIVVYIMSNNGFI